MSERSDDALRAHVRECDECRGAAVPIDALAAAWMPFSLAADFVLTYAISLLALFGSAYAVIPLLLAHPVREPDVQPAG